MDNNRLDDLLVALECGGHNLKREDCLFLVECITEMRNALIMIATEHVSYGENGLSQYSIGVTDGHRCAARIARQALS